MKVLWNGKTMETFLVFIVSACIFATNCYEKDPFDMCRNVSNTRI